MKSIIYTFFKKVCVLFGILDLRRYQGCGWSVARSVGACRFVSGVRSCLETCVLVASMLAVGPPMAMLSRKQYAFTHAVTGRS